jgi:group I intron endonuclease
MGFIYTKTSPSGKSYVGQTTRTLEERFKEHQKEDNNCSAFAAAIKKYGWKNFDTSWYEWVDDDDLDYHETWLIRLMGTLAPNGYNLKGGGSNGKMSDSTSGGHNPMFGKKHTEKTKKKMSDSLVGRTLSNTWKKKISDSLVGRIHYNEWKTKISISMSGEKIIILERRVLFTIMQKKYISTTWMEITYNHLVHAMKPEDF